MITSSNISDHQRFQRVFNKYIKMTVILPNNKGIATPKNYFVIVKFYVCEELKRLFGLTILT